MWQFLPCARGGRTQGTLSDLAISTAVKTLTYPAAPLMPEIALLQGRIAKSRARRCLQPERGRNCQPVLTPQKPDQDRVLPTSASIYARAISKPSRRSGLTHSILITLFSWTWRPNAIHLLHVSPVAPMHGSMSLREEVGSIPAYFALPRTITVGIVSGTKISFATRRAWARFTDAMASLCRVTKSTGSPSSRASRSASAILALESSDSSDVPTMAALAELISSCVGPFS